MLKTGLLLFVAMAILAILRGDREDPYAPHHDQVGEVREYDKQQAKIFDTSLFSGEMEREAYLIVYYFHRNSRCSHCRALERETLAVMEGSFTAEMERGEIVIKDVNVDKPENRHFIEQYGITAPTLLISQQMGGEEGAYKNLDQVWILMRDRDAYQEYLESEIKAFLGVEY